MTKDRWISLAAVVLAIGLGILGYFLFPDQVALQIGINGLPTNYLPKTIGMLLAPAVLILGVVVINMQERAKGLMICLGALILEGFLLFFNLR